MSRDIAEWLAIGTPHPVDPQNIGRSTAWIRWGAVDAGWSMAGLPTCEELLLGTKWLGWNDYNLRAEVVGWARYKVMFWRRGDKATTLDHARDVAEMAVKVFCNRTACTVCNALPCPICKGEEEMLCEYCCPHCGGTEIEPYQSLKQAALSRLDGPRADIERLYDELMAMLSRWEGHGLRVVRRRVRERERGNKLKVNSQVRGGENNANA